MTKTEFNKVVNAIDKIEYENKSKEKKLYSCNAKSFRVELKDGSVYEALKSYRTIVAICPVKMGVEPKVYTDDFYSMTTTQHVNKWAGWLASENGWYRTPEVVKMYKHSKMRVAEYNQMLATDWAC